MEIQNAVDTAGKIIDNLARVIRGKPLVLEHLVNTLLSGGMS